MGSTGLLLIVRCVPEFVHSAQLSVSLFVVIIGVIVTVVADVVALSLHCLCLCSFFSLP